MVKTVKTKVAKRKPRIRVEEIVDEKPEEKPSEKETVAKPAVEVPSEAVDKPKLSSFSQLDSNNTGVSMAEKTETVKEPVSDMPATEVETVEKTQEAKSADDAPSDVSSSSDEVKEWLKDIRPDTTKEVEKKSGFNYGLFFGLVFVFAILGAIAGGLYYYKNKMAPQMAPSENKTTTEAKATPTTEVTATPSASVDLTKLKVNLMNGSGIKGEAAKVKSLLTTAGFDGAKVSTGNASTNDFKATSVSFKKDVADAVFDKIKSSLGSLYDVQKAVGNLKDSSSNDIEIVIGEIKK